MASSNCVPNQDLPVVLRVKRKRTEDPVDALVIQSKVSKSDTDALSAASPGIFQLCGSVDQTGDITGKHTDSILDIVKSFKRRLNQSKVNPLANLSLDDCKEKRRNIKKKSSSNHRYKLLSTLRCLGDAVRVYDAMDCEIEQEKYGVPTEITCNSSLMTRQKVKLTGDDDFIIDIYYGNQISMESLQDAVVSPYEAELVHDIFDTDEERYEDEDDSNDECNWRNDYPDEDGEDSCSLDSNEEYRHRDVYYDEYDWERADDYSSGGEHY